MTNLQTEMQRIQEAPIEFLAFSGGGAKGAIYSGVYAALKESEIIEGVRAVAGSSAGAIAATVIASGIDAQDFERITKETNLKSLLGKGKRSLGSVSVPSFLHRDGAPLYELLDNTIRANLLHFFNEHNVMEICQSRFDNIRKAQQHAEEQLIIDEKKKDLFQQQVDNSPGFATNIEDNLKELRTQSVKIQSIINNEGQELVALKEKCIGGGKISFKDLALLRLLDPVQFKDLVITAVRQDNGELQIFNAETPNIEIALACCASAAIPVVFEPVEIDGIKYVDGGCKDNIPMKHFSKGESDSHIKDLTNDLEKIHEAKKQGRTLALAFGSNLGDTANIAVYSIKETIYTPNAIAEFLCNLLVKILVKITGKFKYAESYVESENNTYNNLRENALDTIVLNTQNIGTLDFGGAQKYADYLHIKGYYQALNHFHNHELGKAVGDTFAHQEFLLNVYENYHNEHLNKTGYRKVLEHIGKKTLNYMGEQVLGHDGKELLDKVIPQQEQLTPASWLDRVMNQHHQQKASELLSFCKPEKWQGKVQLSSILEDYVVRVTTAHNNEIKTNIKAMDSLIKTLNHATTSNKVKEDFIALLDMYEELDVRFDKSKSRTENLVKLQFVQEDFQKFVSKHHHESLYIDNKDSNNINRSHG